MSSSLPPELWLNIFPTVPLSTLPSLTLTSRRFRDLAQPLLFSRITVSPFTATLFPHSARPHTRSTFSHAQERLEFLSGENIRASIKEVNVKPDQMPALLPGMAQSAHDEVHIEEFTQMILGYIPCFPNLERLNLSFMHLTAAMLASLPYITNLNLMFCSAPEMEPPRDRRRLLRVENITIDKPSKDDMFIQAYITSCPPATPMAALDPSFASHLSPRHLKTIASGTPGLVQGLLNHHASLPAMESIQLPSSTPMPIVRALLSRTPSLKAFHIPAPSQSQLSRPKLSSHPSSPGAQISFPKTLETYEGPTSLLPNDSPAPSLKAASIWSDVPLPQGVIHTSTGARGQLDVPGTHLKHLARVAPALEGLEVRIRTLGEHTGEEGDITDELGLFSKLRRLRMLVSHGSEAQVNISFTYRTTQSLIHILGSGQGNAPTSSFVPA